MSKSNNYREDDLRKDEGVTIIGNLDFSQIEELDPSLSEGHRMNYERQVPFELRLEDTNGPQDSANFEVIGAKILIVGDDTNPTHLRIELSCENDLFFHFTCE
jgi:hypothetical protein